GRVLEADDEVGDVAFHHLLLGQDVLDSRILDIEIGCANRLIRLGKLIENHARLLDPGAHIFNSAFRTRNLGIKILQRCHALCSGPKGTFKFTCAEYMWRRQRWKEGTPG